MLSTSNISVTELQGDVTIALFKIIGPCNDALFADDQTQHSVSGIEIKNHNGNHDKTDADECDDDTGVQETYP